MNYQSAYTPDLFAGQSILVTSGQYPVPLEAISAKGWEAVLNTSLTGGFWMAGECFLLSMAKHGGGIVNIVADRSGSMPGMRHSGAARGMVKAHYGHNVKP